MKNKIIITAILIIILIGLTAFIIINELDNQISDLQNYTTNEGENMQESQTNNIPEINSNSNNEATRVKLTINSEEIYITLDNNEASKDFIEMLPLTVEFEDYNNTEKIATLPQELTTQGSPSGYTPEIGDFAYYAPWGNLSLFYKEFRYSNSLIKLGKFESDIQKISALTTNFTATFELVTD